MKVVKIHKVSWASNLLLSDRVTKSCLSCLFSENLFSSLLSNHLLGFEAIFIPLLLFLLKIQDVWYHDTVGECLSKACLLSVWAYQTLSVALNTITQLGVTQCFMWNTISSLQYRSIQRLTHISGKIKVVQFGFSHRNYSSAGHQAIMSNHTTFSLHWFWYVGLLYGGKW